METCIASLAGNPTPEAATALASLPESALLKHWFDNLELAISDQSIARRKGLSRAMPAKVVTQTLPI